jgi:hypothetical protein
MLLLSIFPVNVFAVDDVEYTWAKSIGGIGTDSGYSITVDTDGNVYTTGYFNDTADFDPGAGTSNLTSAGSNDMFISKLDSSGDFVWAKSIGGAAGDLGTFITLDTDGNIYTTGFFNGTIDFDPGAGTSNLTSAGNDIFISKLDSSGDFVWAKSIGGTGTDQGQSLVFDTDGNIYITGYFNDTVDFDPGAGTSNLTSAGSNDIFISKLDSSGDFVWAKSIGGTGTDQGQSMVLDTDSNIYVTGFFNSTVDFDPGAGTSNLTSAGSHDMFISKLDSSGDFVWAKSTGGTGADFSNSITLNTDGGVYTTGHFQNTVDFDPGVGTSNLTSAGSYDFFIRKLDSSGDFVWAKSTGGTGGDQSQSIVLDTDSNIYTAGHFNDTVDFDPGAGASNLTSAGSNDVFIRKLDSSGDFVWAKSTGGTGSEFSRSMTLDTDGNIYTTGFFPGTADFDPGAGTSNLTSAGGDDIFISKLTPLIITYSLTYTAGSNGSLTGTMSQTINEGEDGTAVTAVPDSGYQFTEWSDASTDNPRVDTVVFANVNVTANFEIIPVSNTSGSRRSSRSTTSIEASTVNSTNTSSPESAVPSVCTITTNILKISSRSADISCLQQKLNTLLTSNLVMDGIFGSLTKQAVVDFQIKNNLIPDGIVGPITRGFLR